MWWIFAIPSLNQHSYFLLALRATQQNVACVPVAQSRLGHGWALLIAYVKSFYFDLKSNSRQMSSIHKNKCEECKTILIKTPKIILSRHVKVFLMGVFLLLYLSRTERTASASSVHHVIFPRPQRPSCPLPQRVIQQFLGLITPSTGKTHSERSRAACRFPAAFDPSADSARTRRIIIGFTVHLSHPPTPPATLCHFRWPSSRAPAANWGSLVSSQSFSCRRPADHQAWCTNEVFSVIVPIRRTKQEIFDALGLFHPTPSHNDNSVMCTFYNFIIPHLLHSSLVLSCCVLGGVLKAVFRVSLSVHAEIKEHQVSSPAFQDVQPNTAATEPTQPSISLLSIFLCRRWVWGLRSHVRYVCLFQQRRPALRSEFSSMVPCLCYSGSLSPSDSTVLSSPRTYPWRHLVVEFPLPRLRLPFKKLCEEQTSSLQDIISRFRVQGSYSERTAQGLF